MKVTSIISDEQQVYSIYYFIKAQNPSKNEKNSIWSIHITKKKFDLIQTRLNSNSFNEKVFHNFKILPLRTILSF